MSFFLKKTKSTANGAKLSGTRNNRKRKSDKISKKNDEVTSSEEEDDFNHVDNHIGSAESSEDENETAQEKKLRLAKIYLEEIEREERQRLEDDTEEVDKEVLSKRLRDDHLKQIGKYEITVAHKYSGVTESDVKILKCREQKNTVTCLCITSDDQFVFSGSKDGVIVKWSLRDSKKVGVIPFVKTNVDRILGHSSCISSIAISSDQKFLVVGDGSSMIQIWNPDTLKHINTLKGHRQPVTGLCFKQSSYTLYSSSKDRSVRVWSLDEMAFVETLFGHQDGITSIDVLNSERPVTAGGRDGTIRLWKVSEESQLIFNTTGCSVDTVKLINEQNFLSGSDNGQVMVWSGLKKKPVGTVQAAHGTNPDNLQPYWISSVTALPHSDLIASGSEDGVIRLWKLSDKLKTITPLLEIPCPGFVNALSFTSDGKFLIAGCGKDHRLGRWNVVKSATNCIRVFPLKIDN